MDFKAWFTSPLEDEDGDEIILLKPTTKACPKLIPRLRKSDFRKLNSLSLTLVEDLATLPAHYTERANEWYSDIKALAPRAWRKAHR